MKKIKSICTALILSVCITGGATATPAYASTLQGSVTQTTYEYYDDGTYLETVITLFPSINNSSTYSTDKTCSGSKLATLKNSDDETLFSATVHGTFSYNGSTSKCTSASVTCFFTDDDWYFVEKSAEKSENKAIGHVTGKLLMAGITIKKQTINVTLTCSKDGKLS